MNKNRFNWNGETESKASERATAHLRDQLQHFTSMNYFTCVDVHSRADYSSLTFKYNDVLYTGGTDCVILPKKSSKYQLSQMRVIVEFKLFEDNTDSDNKITLHKFKVYNIMAYLNVSKCIKCIFISYNLKFLNMY